MAYQTQTLLQGGILSASLRRMTETLRDRMEKRRIYKTTLRELQALGKRELDDLGLHASQINRIAWQAAYGK